MKSIDKEEIVLIEIRILEAIRKSDAEQIDELLHEDLLFHTPNGDIVTKEMDLAAHRSGTMVVESLDVLEQQIMTVGDTAIVSMILITKGKMLGEPIQGTFRFLRVWKLIDDKLKVIGGSCIQCNL